MASRLVAACVLAAALAVPAAARSAEATPLAADAALEARTMEVAQGLRCLVCQNESIAASQSELAVDLRGQVRKMLSQDKTPDEVRDYMVARYGEFVLMKPRLSATTLLLWVGPFAILAGVLGALGMALRRRRRAAGAGSQRVAFGAVPSAIDATWAPSVSAGSSGLLMAAGQANWNKPAGRAVPNAPTATTAPLSQRARAGLGLAICASAIGLYGWLGNPAGLGPTAGPPPAADVPDQAVEAMLDAMAQKMATQTPGSTDAAGWTLLARSYASLQRFDDASRAYAQALALAPDDAQLLVDQADVLAMRQGGRTEGEPSRLIARALRIAPDNLKALALGGTDAFERQDFAEAGRLWSKARMLASPGAFAERMQANLDALPDSQTHTATSAWVSGRVRLSPSLAASVRPGDTLFVFARAENGPRMPLAIARYSASALPMEFRLDDSNAMSGALRMSGHARVVVGARISRSGEALPRSGDVYGESGSVETGRGDVDIVIDAVVP